jgi:hypothetical protein
MGSRVLQQCCPRFTRLMSPAQSFWSDDQACAYDLYIHTCVRRRSNLGFFCLYVRRPGAPYSRSNYAHPMEKNRHGHRLSLVCFAQSHAAIPIRIREISSTYISTVRTNMCKKQQLLSCTNYSLRITTKRIRNFAGFVAKADRLKIRDALV